MRINIPGTKTRLKKQLNKIKNAAIAEIKKIEKLPASERGNINVTSSIKEIERNFQKIIDEL